MTLYTRFFGSSTAAGDQGGASRSLVLGGVLYVNGGQVGINDVLNKTYSLRMGSVATMNAAVGANAIAIGSSQSSAADATKASLATQASGARAIAIGAKTTASAVDAVAVGSGATANTGSFSVAIGANTSAVNGGVAVGGGSLVTVTDGAVALGLNSVASTGKGLAGYDPGTKTTSTDVSATWKSTLSAVSIGDVSGTTIKTRQLSGLAAGTSMTDAVNVAQLKVVDEIASKGWNLTASGVNSGKVAPGSSVDLKNTDKNLTITKAIGSNDVAFNLAKDVKIGTLTVGNTLLNTDGMAFGSDVALGKTGLTIANGPSVTGSGIDAGGKVISHVAAGEVSATSTEAVNGSQLSAVQAQANQPMTFTGNEGSVARTLGQTLAISGESSTAGSYSGANLKSVVDAATGTLHLQLAESPQFGKVQINDGGKISGVAPGTAETDVPNMGQLKSISESVDKGWNLTAAGANTSKVVSGATVDLKNTDGNLTISKTSDSNDVVFNLSKDFKVDGVTAGTTVVNNDGVQVGSDVALGKTGLTIANGPSVTGSGIDAGSQKITHVAAGTEETDAVNFSQLKSISESVGKGWNLTVSGANASKVAAGATVDLKNTDGNLTISKSSDSNDVVFNLSKDFKVDGVTAGNTVMNNDGVKVGSDVALGLTGLVIMGGPSVTNTGINAGNQKIINVAAAMADTDAVNFAQLKHAVANVSVKPAHYYSTNDGGTPGGNYDGDGATGIGSVAAGVGTQASGEGAVVVGAGAMGSGKGSVAMGRNASASADGSVVLGTGAKDGGRGAENYIGKYSGVENKTVGTVSLGDATKGETRTISNVADAKEATDAVNLRQLDYVAQQVNHYTDDKMQGLSDIQNVFKINNSKSSSSKGIALNAMAIGTDATASGVDGVAMGNNANVSANNAVAIGANSVADRPNTVSMGSAGSQRQVTNVAPATTETDAVNLGQLNQGVITAKQYTDGMVGNLRRDGNGGVAAAIATANLPQAYVPGRGMASLGVSSYQGQSAIAVGVSAVSDSGHWVFKFSGTTNTRSQAGVGAGVGYQW
ncbi:YadA-like family protein [Xylella taiwanensis]|uniref:YadA-like family protein n=1 Tax=Xylella taiwanensis TaxID=1444770 RepID=UPI003CCE85C2